MPTLNQLFSLQTCSPQHSRRRYFDGLLLTLFLVASNPSECLGANLVYQNLICKVEILEKPLNPPLPQNRFTDWVTTTWVEVGDNDIYFLYSGDIWVEAGGARDAKEYNFDLEISGLGDYKVSKLESHNFVNPVNKVKLSDIRPLDPEVIISANKFPTISFTVTNQSEGPESKIIHFVPIDLEFSNRLMAAAVPQEWKRIHWIKQIGASIGAMKDDELKLRVRPVPGLAELEAKLAWQGFKPGNGSKIDFKSPEKQTFKQEFILAGTPRILAYADVIAETATGQDRADWEYENPLKIPGALLSKEEAERWSTDNVAALGGGNVEGRTDAARHAYLSGLLTMEIGIVSAEELGTAHEVEFPGNHNSQVMDLINNRVGRSLYQAGFGLLQLQNAVVLSLNQGDLIILDDLVNDREKGLLIKSNE